MVMLRNPILVMVQVKGVTSLLQNDISEDKNDFNLRKGELMLAMCKKDRNPEVYVKAIVEDVILRTRVFPDKNVNPKWNEDLMFVVVEPFSNPLRMLPLPADPLWYNLGEIVFEEGMEKKVNFFSKLNMSVSLEGKYHVFDKSIPIGSDYRLTTKVLWTTMIEVLELGIINASSLQPMNRANPGGYFEMQSPRAQG
ncbi:hypothetical protein Goshw_000698 [Gossypium schwendimanii]|uniref:C2 domain-containing protein n=1 Tax=Gossypium schwendimanii TaxID=34291 RepID=A0A7J9MEV7_GOSSC|nr:hypothetical protein [Gossypium schwendimanii]